MKKFFNKWTRKFHRWIAIPMIIIIPLAVISSFPEQELNACRPKLSNFNLSCCCCWLSAELIYT